MRINQSINKTLSHNKIIKRGTFVNKLTLTT